MADAAKPEQIGVTVLERSGRVIPVKLSCPLARETCKGTASLKGKKLRAGRIYTLEAAPFKFKEFAGGSSKKIRFRLSKKARATVKRAHGMTVEFVIKASYGVGRPGTVRTRATLAP